MKRTIDDKTKAIESFKMWTESHTIKFFYSTCVDKQTHNSRISTRTYPTPTVVQISLVDVWKAIYNLIIYCTKLWVVHNRFVKYPRRNLHKSNITSDVVEAEIFPRDRSRRPRYWIKIMRFRRAFNFNFPTF